MAQRQWRSDDTSTWSYGFGDGSDGDVTISSNTTEAPIDASCSGTSGTTSLSATNVSFAIGQLILIHQTRGTGVGNWELNKIASYVAGTITLSHALINTYTDSGSSQAQVRVLKQYNNVTVNSGITWTAKAWNGDVGGILGFFTKGTLTVNGAISLLGNTGLPVQSGGTGGAGIGFYGGNGANGYVGLQGEGSPAAGGTSSASANGNGGGGASLISGSGGSGGGNGTAGTVGNLTSGSAGAADGNAALTDMVFGGGGGGGSRNSSSSGEYGGGGGGGGIALIIANDIVVHASTGSINLNGGAASATYWSGGGGAGGSCLIKCKTATLNTNRITASAGLSSGLNGVGVGGVGRIHIDYSGSYTGTTSPTIDATNDTSITEPSSGAFFQMF